MSGAAAGEPRDAATAGRLRRAGARFALFALLIALLAAALLLTPASRLLDRDVLVALLGALREAWWAPLALVGGYVVVSPSGIPISPLILAGGAVFGPLWGWIYSSVGSLLGAIVSFALARGLGQELIEQLAGERRMRRVETILERHGFWTLVGVRFLPIPFALINYGAALSGLRFPRFLGSTVIGLVPSILMWNYLAYLLVSVAVEERGALLRNFSLLLALIALLMLLRPLGRALLKRDRSPEREVDV